MICVAFRTDRFRGVEIVRHGGDARRFGEECARWLVTALRAAGVQVEAATAADYGWHAAVLNEARPASLTIGLASEDPPEWRVLVEAPRRLLGGFLVRPDVQVERRLAAAIRAVLADAPDVSDVH